MTVSEELIYHVDAEDLVLGPCKRGDAHRIGLRHRAVHILVFNGAGEVYLQKRSPWKDCNPGLWDSSAAGHVDFGESYEACAVRELAEELAICVEHCPENLFTLPANAENGWEFIRAYRLLWDGPVAPDPEEIDTGNWVPAPALDRRVLAADRTLTATFSLIWQRFRALPAER